LAIFLDVDWSVNQLVSVHTHYVCIFSRIWITERISTAGDYITLRAEEDLLIAISNCPQERNPCNTVKPTRPRVVVEGAA